MSLKIVLKKLLFLLGYLIWIILVAYAGSSKIGFFKPPSSHLPTELEIIGILIGFMLLHALLLSVLGVLIIQITQVSKGTVTISLILSLIVLMLTSFFGVYLHPFPPLPIAYSDYAAKFYLTYGCIQTISLIPLYLLGMQNQKRNKAINKALRKD